LVALFKAAGTDIETPQRQAYAFGRPVFECIGTKEQVGDPILLVFIRPFSNKLRCPAIGCTKAVYRLACGAKVNLKDTGFFLFAGVYAKKDAIRRSVVFRSGGWFIRTLSECERRKE